MLQSLLDDAAFHLVEIILYLHGTRIKRRNGAVIERSFARVRFGNIVKREAAAFSLNLWGILNLQVVHLYHLADRQCDGAFEDVFQFAEVAGIAVMQQGFLGFGAEFVGLIAVTVFIQQIQNQRAQVFAHFAQRRHVQGDYVEAVIQVLTECAAFDQSFEVFVSCTNNAHIYKGFPRIADTAHGFFLNGAQEFDLHGKRQIGNFVKEQSAAVSVLEKT